MSNAIAAAPPRLPIPKGSLAFLTAATASPAGDDCEAAFQSWKALGQAVNNSSDNDANDGTNDTRLAEMDSLEVTILADGAATPRAAERKLWMALSHDCNLVDWDENMAVVREDLDYFQRRDNDLGWSHRLLFAVLTTLRREQAAQ